MTTKCIKVALNYISKENFLSKTEFDKLLFDLQLRTQRACNRAITEYWVHDMQYLKAKENNEELKSDKELYGKSFKAVVNSIINNIMGDDISANVTDAISQYVAKRYSNDKKQGLLKGNTTLSEFKRDIPVILRNRGYKVISTNKGLGVELRLFSADKQKELGLKRGTGIKVVFPKLDNSAKAVLKRIITEEYKQGSLQLTYNKRKKKWLCLISYTFESKQAANLDKGRILGVDLGITNVATLSVYDNDKEQYIDMYWKERVIEGKELIHYRQKLEQRRRDLSIASKWASDNRTGHGYKNRMLSANKVGDKYNRFKDTFNHKVSRYIVDLAVKYKCSRIQLEDLSGFNEYQTESLLKNWCYYDLQNKIKYKAKENGIEVILVNPKYTSKRCSRCGCIHVDNRNCKHNQADFTCKVCGHKDNADINASKNLAVRDIDLIIKDTEILTDSCNNSNVNTYNIVYDFKDTQQMSMLFDN